MEDVGGNGGADGWWVLVAMVVDGGCMVDWGDRVWWCSWLEVVGGAIEVHGGCWSAGLRHLILERFSLNICGARR